MKFLIKVVVFLGLLSSTAYAQIDCPTLEKLSKSRFSHAYKNNNLYMLQGNIEASWQMFTTWFPADSAEDALAKVNAVLLTKSLTIFENTGQSCWYSMHIDGVVRQFEVMKL